jgi:YD repeat-containing protein
MKNVFDEFLKGPRTITPAKTGAQPSCRRKPGIISHAGSLFSSGTLDSGLRRNDENRTDRTFDETMIFRILRGVRRGTIALLFVIGLSAALPGMIHAESIAYAYDANGQLIKADYGGGKTITYTYDEAGNILTITATGTSQQFDLTVSKSGAGSGTVTSNPAGINCGTDCQEAFNFNTQVSLTAAPATGSTFGGWSGACSGTEACTVTMNGDKTVTASFGQQASQEYSLTIEKTGTGNGVVTSSPAGINCGSDCEEAYSKVQKVKLTAKADANSIFAGWTGGGCAGSKTCSTNVDGDITVAASFTAKVPDISVSQTAVDFGVVAVGKKKTLPVKISNLGTGDLLLNLDGLGGSDFALTGNESLTIKPKKSYTLKLTFKPASAGFKAATLRANSNDPDTPVTEISLTGTDGQVPTEILFRPGPGKNDGSDNGSSNGGKDAFISGSFPTASYGSEPNIVGLPRSNCNPAEARGYIQFDLSSLPVNVQQVFLGVTHFPHTNSCIANCNADFYFYPVTQPWNEMTISFNTKPTEGAAVHGPINISFPNDLKNREYDITGIYRNWKNGSVSNQGLAIYSSTVGCNNAAVGFNVHSSDDPDQSLRPYLRIIP